jgi:hypothetical protein
MTPEQLEHWLTERIEAERKATLEVVTAAIKDILSAQIRDCEALGQKFDQQFASLEGLFGRMRSLTERMAALDRAEHGHPPIAGAKMN